ncbi:MAG: L-asparagine oxygenase [Solirubrobacteraceae bacterium]|nr:L-asparagine oxygenase [Solirubrobacteraceae bacterium]
MVEVRTLAEPLVQQIESEAQRLAATVDRVGDRAAVEEAKRCAARLSPALAGECRPVGDSGAVVLRGLRAADMPLGPTPPSWSEAPRDATPHWDATLLLVASVLGCPFGWEGQQDGRLVHDIVPAKGHEHEQTGASSSVVLSAHTEDAFHPGRANVLLLACLRNHDDVPTSLASVRYARLSAVERALLERPTLPILPDDSYDETHGPAAASPPEVATLWDGDGGLRIRYDPAYTPLERADDDYRAAYDWLSEELERVAVDVPLGPGEILVVDNDVAVHGRRPFQARYDGTDRWLKRVSVRLLDGERPAFEAAEHGYGQRLIDPLASS